MAQKEAPESGAQKARAKIVRLAMLPELSKTDWERPAYEVCRFCKMLEVGL